MDRANDASLSKVLLSRRGRNSRAASRERVLRIVDQIMGHTYIKKSPWRGRGPMKAIRVFVAEDNEGDVFLIEAALRLHNFEFQLDVEADGLAAIRYVQHI